MRFPLVVCVFVCVIAVIAILLFPCSPSPPTLTSTAWSLTRQVLQSQAPKIVAVTDVTGAVHDQNR